MDIKKFLTWENAGKVAVAYAAFKYLREDPLPTKIHPSDCGGKVGEYNALGKSQGNSQLVTVTYKKISREKKNTGKPFFISLD